MSFRKLIIPVLVLALVLSAAGSAFAEASGDASAPAEYTGIISAMQNEVNLLLAQAEIERVDRVGPVDFHVGTLCGRRVVIAKAGVGKVLAASGITAMLNRYPVSSVIFTGIAGGVGDETKVLDEVVATRLIQHDYGQITADGFEWFRGSDGEADFCDCDPELVDLAFESAVKELGEEHVFRGVIATGDQFVASEDYVRKLQEDFGVVACEMEGAAVAAVCSRYGVPFVVIRAMSDKADGLAHETYENMADTAADNSCRIVLEMLGRMAKTEEARMNKIRIKVLILPKFEIGSITGDFPGEGQHYYMHYLEGSDSYEIPGGGGDSRLYVRDGVGLYLLGMGKISAALSTMALLSDDRFDFSGAYILSVGCAGSAEGTTVMGDVFVITSAVDYDLGHHADSRELADPSGATWFHDESFDSMAVVRLDPGLTDKVWNLVRDVRVNTTERTRSFMRAAFNGAEWAVRDPKVLRGTAVTADNYWKGARGHENALLMVETYGCPDPYAATEMEDVAVCRAVERMGMLDRLIILRDSVNMDVFMMGATPESLWNADGGAEASLISEDSTEAADIFETAMKNNFEVGRVIIDAILDGSF